MADLEAAACTPEPVEKSRFNSEADLPYGLKVGDIYRAMSEFVDYLGFVNGQLNKRGSKRLESMIMPANFSSMVGEFVGSEIPKSCSTLCKNRYHNGHPDLIPKGRYPGDSVQHASEGVEIKASRYMKGWQGHNPEETWLMVFVFDSNRPVDEPAEARPFRFVKVVGAALKKSDWIYSGRSETSRRTITASVKPSGLEKMEANWIYRAAS